MRSFELHIGTHRTLGSAVLASAACFSLFLCIRPVFKPKAITPIARAKARTETRQLGTEAAQLVYPPDAFPGGRDVDTPYGTIKVFEWGPEDGDKVMIMPGASTPCIAMGDMAREFVSRGCRVMVFGESLKRSYWEHVSFGLKPGFNSTLRHCPFPRSR